MENDPLHPHLKSFEATCRDKCDFWAKVKIDMRGIEDPSIASWAAARALNERLKHHIMSGKCKNFETQSPPRVLVCIPYHKAKQYCLNQLYSSLEHLTYPNKEIVIRHDPGEYGRKDAVKEQREFFRQLALNGKFDYLYFHGADTIPPADAIETLLSANRPIIGGVYWTRAPADTCHAIASLDQGQTDLKDRMLLPNQEVRYQEVASSGLDCMLIRRDVLERIGWLEWSVNDDDWPYCGILRKLGYSITLDTSVQCEHWHDERSYSLAGKFYQKDDISP